MSAMSSLFPATDCSTPTEQRLKSFVDQSQLFLSVAQPGLLDLTSANGDVLCRDCRNLTDHRHKVRGGELVNTLLHQNTKKSTRCRTRSQ